MARIIGMVVLRTAVAEVTREVVRECIKAGKLGCKSLRNRMTDDQIDHLVDSVVFEDEV